MNINMQRPTTGMPYLLKINNAYDKLKRPRMCKKTRAVMQHLLYRLFIITLTPLPPSSQIPHHVRYDFHELGQSSTVVAMSIIHISTRGELSGWRQTTRYLTFNKHDQQARKGSEHERTQKTCLIKQTTRYLTFNKHDKQARTGSEHKQTQKTCLIKQTTATVNTPSYIIIQRRHFFTTAEPLSSAKRILSWTSSAWRFILERTAYIDNVNIWTAPSWVLA